MSYVSNVQPNHFFAISQFFLKNYREQSAKQHDYCDGHCQDVLAAKARFSIDPWPSFSDNIAQWKHVLSHWRRTPRDIKVRILSVFAIIICQTKILL